MSKEQEVGTITAPIEKIEAEKLETSESVEIGQLAPAVKEEAVPATVEKETPLLKAKTKKNRLSSFFSKAPAKALPKSTESVEKNTEDASEKAGAESTTVDQMVEAETGKVEEKTEEIAKMEPTPTPAIDDSPKKDVLPPIF